MNFDAFIFARGGSKGLPGKNVRLFNGKPLIAWAIEAAKATSRIDCVYVSTDSEEIAKVAADAGAIVPFLRPADLATDTSPEWLSWRHAVEYLQQNGRKCPDAMVSLPATAPLRSVQDIDNCLDVYEAGNFDSVITVTSAHHNPYFNMVRKLPDNTVEVCLGGKDKVSRRQDVPEIYNITTVAYVVSTDFILNHNALFEGRVGMVQVPEERGIDIDTALDFEVAEFLARRNLNE